MTTAWSTSLVLSTVRMTGPSGTADGTPSNDVAAVVNAISLNPQLSRMNSISSVYASPSGWSASAAATTVATVSSRSSGASAVRSSRAPWRAASSSPAAAVSAAITAAQNPSTPGAAVPVPTVPVVESSPVEAESPLLADPAVPPSSSSSPLQATSAAVVKRATRQARPVNGPRHGQRLFHGWPGHHKSPPCRHTLGHRRRTRRRAVEERRFLGALEPTSADGHPRHGGGAGGGDGAHRAGPYGIR